MTTLRLATILPIPALTVLGEVLVLVLGAVWLVVAGRTVHGAWRGDLFIAPCLKDD